MSEKKINRPSLKNFLSTGKISVEPEPEKKEIKEKKKEKISSPKKVAPKKEKITQALPPEEIQPEPEVVVEPEIIAEKADFSWLLKILSHDDLETWGGIIDSGAPFSEEKLDFVALREKFRTMDRVQFTLYILESEGAPMRMIRSGVQIREPFVLFLLWDDNGVATIYR